MLAMSVQSVAENYANVADASIFAEYVFGLSDTNNAETVCSPILTKAEADR